MRKNRRKLPARVSHTIRGHMVGYIINILVAVVVGFATYYYVESITVSAVLALCLGLLIASLRLLHSFFKERELIVTELMRIRENNYTALGLVGAGKMIGISDFDKHKNSSEDWEYSTNHNSVIRFLDQMYMGRNSLENNFQIFAYNIYASALVMSASKKLQTVKSGYLTSEDDLSIHLTEQLYSRVDESVFAFSYANLKFWSSPKGKDFLDYTLSACKNKVHVVRVFVVTSLVSDKDSLIECLKLHLEFKQQNVDTEKYYTIATVAQFDNATVKSKTSNSRDVLFSNTDQRAIPDISIFDDKIISAWDFGDTEESVNRVNIIFKDSALMDSLNLVNFLQKDRYWKEVQSIEDINDLNEEFTGVDPDPNPIV